MVIKSVRSVRQGEVLTPSTAAYRLSNQFIGLSDYCRHIVTTVFFGNPWQSFFSHFFPFSVNDTSQFSCTILFVLTMSLWNKKQWWVMPLPVWRIELFQISTKTIDIGDHISWDATLVTSLVNIGGRLRSVERSTVSNSLGSIMHHKLILLRNVNSHSRSLYVVVRPSVVCLSVCLQRSCTLLRRLKFSAMFLRPLLRWPSADHQDEILKRSSQRIPSVGGVKHKRGSRM